MIHAWISIFVSKNNPLIVRIVFESVAISLNETDPASEANSLVTPSRMFSRLLLLWGQPKKT
jgi:hypothetical protein